MIWGQHGGGGPRTQPDTGVRGREIKAHRCMGTQAALLRGLLWPSGNTSHQGASGTRGCRSRHPWRRGGFVEVRALPGATVVSNSNSSDLFICTCESFLGPRETRGDDGLVMTMSRIRARANGTQGDSAASLGEGCQRQQRGVGVRQNLY